VTNSTRSFVLLLALHFAACTSAPTVHSPNPTPAATPESKPEPLVTEPPPVPELPDKSSMRVSIVAVGDMMIGTDFPENHLPDDDGVSFLHAVTPLISAADVAFGNLEGVLLDGGEPSKKCSNPAACYLFRSPTRYALHYKEAGFDVLSLANNHARDFGEDGRSSSMEALSAHGMVHSGRVDEFASVQKNGLSIAFLAYAVTRNSNMMLDYELAFAAIAAFAEQHDIVVVSFHGGAEGVDVTHVPFREEEYYGEPRGDVVWFSRGAVDAGADLVIGHGPHVVRGMERYKDRLIAYSLGNFATYYGISVAGIKGIAPILTVNLDGHGAFLHGQIDSTIQLRPDGPSIDAKNRALNLIRGLSIDDFGNAGINFAPDGLLTPVARGPIDPHELVASPD
jgi:hypothetical protein